jgi:hypothetical protein
LFMDGWKKLFHCIPRHTRSFQPVGADVSFLFLMHLLHLWFSWMRRLVSWTSVLSFFFSYSLARCFSLIYLFIYFPMKLSELLKLPLHFGLILAGCFSLLACLLAWLIDWFIFLWNYLNLLKLPLHFGLVLAGVIQAGIDS